MYFTLSFGGSDCWDMIEGFDNTHTFWAPPFYVSDGSSGTSQASDPINRGISE